MPNPHLQNVLLSKVPELEQDNFGDWKKAMGPTLTAYGAEYLLKSTSTTTLPTVKADIDSDLGLVIYSTLSKSIAELVGDEYSSGLACWKKIIGYFERSSIQNRIAARQALYSFRHDPDHHIDFFFATFEKLRDAVKNLGGDIDDTEALDLVMLKLDASHDAQRAHILSTMESPTYQSVKTFLRSKAGPKLNIKTEDVEVSILGAANVAQRGGGRSGGVRGAGGGARSGVGEGFRSDENSGSDGGTASFPVIDGRTWCCPTNEGRCHRCGQVGHVAMRCMASMPQSVKDWIMASRNSANQASVDFFVDVGGPPEAGSASVMSLGIDSIPVSSSSSSSSRRRRRRNRQGSFSTSRASSRSPSGERRTPIQLVT